MFLPGTKGQFVTREMGRVLGWKAPSIRLTGRWAAHAADGYARISGERGVVIGHGMEDALEILPALATPYGDLIPMTVALVVPDAELKRLAGAAGESVANQVTLLRYKKDLKKVENWPTLHLLLCGLRLPATVIAEAVRIASEPYVSKYKGSNPGPRYLNASKRPLIAMRSEILSTHNALEIAAFAQAIRAPVALLPGVTTEDPGKLQQLLDSAGLPLLYPASMVWSEAFLRADYIVRLRCNIHEGVMHGLRDFPLRARHEMYATPEIKKVRSDAASATKRERWVAALNRRQAKMKCLLTNYAHKLRRQRPVHPAYAAWRITENAPRDTVFVAEGNGTGMWLWSYAHGRTVVYPDRMATIGLSLA
ncbi:MAG: thiamine pyrophosphate-binding protein, partial [Leptospirales bacterium]